MPYFIFIHDIALLQSATLTQYFADSQNFLHISHCFPTTPAPEIFLSTSASFPYMIYNGADAILVDSLCWSKLKNTNCGPVSALSALRN